MFASRTAAHPQHGSATRARRASVQTLLLVLPLGGGASLPRRSRGSLRRPPPGAAAARGAAGGQLRRRPTGRRAAGAAPVRRLFPRRRAAAVTWPQQWASRRRRAAKGRGGRPHRLDDCHPLGHCDPPRRLRLCVKFLRHRRPRHPLTLGPCCTLPPAYCAHGAVVRPGGAAPHLPPQGLLLWRAVVPLCAAPHRADWLLGHPAGRVWRLPRARLPAGGCGAEPLLWPRAHPRGVRAAGGHAGRLFCRLLLRPGRGHGGERRGLRGAVPLRRRDLPRGDKGWGEVDTSGVRHVQGRGWRAAAKARAQQALQHVQPLRGKV